MKRKEKKSLANDVIRTAELLNEYLYFLARAVYNYNTVHGSVSYGTYLAEQLGEVYENDLGGRFMIIYKQVEMEEKRNERDGYFN